MYVCSSTGKGRTVPGTQSGTEENLGDDVRCMSSLSAAVHLERGQLLHAVRAFVSSRKVCTYGVITVRLRMQRYIYRIHHCYIDILQEGRKCNHHQHVECSVNSLVMFRRELN